MVFPQYSSKAGRSRGVFLQGEWQCYVYNNVVVHDPQYVGIEDCSEEGSVLRNNDVIPPPPGTTGGG